MTALRPLCARAVTSLLGVALVALLAGCRGDSAGASSEGGLATPVAASAPVGAAVSPRFKPMLDRVLRLRQGSAAGDARVWPAVEPLLQEGVALLKARMPNDLARPDVSRFNASRAAFGKALQDVAAARASQDLRALDAGLIDLEGATPSVVRCTSGAGPRVLAVEALS